MRRVEFTKKDIKDFPAKPTADYLQENIIEPSTGLRFTINDYRFIENHKFSVIIINQHKKSKEYLTKINILHRIVDLCKLCKQKGDTVDFEKLEVDILIPNNFQLSLE